MCLQLEERKTLIILNALKSTNQQGIPFRTMGLDKRKLISILSLSKYLVADCSEVGVKVPSV